MECTYKEIVQQRKNFQIKYQTLNKIIINQCHKWKYVTFSLKKNYK